MTVNPLRSLPAVETLLQHDALTALALEVPRALLVEAVRAELAAARSALRREGAVAPAVDALATCAAARARAASRPALTRVLNATGIVLHTNLGRAPLAEVARRAVAEAAAGYCSLEYDLEAGRRGDRGAGVERWLTRLTGAEAAVVVNNGAAALSLSATLNDGDSWSPVLNAANTAAPAAGVLLLLLSALLATLAPHGTSAAQPRACALARAVLLAGRVEGFDEATVLASSNPFYQEALQLSGLQ